MGIRAAGKTTSAHAALGLVCSKQPDALIAPLELADSEMEALELLGGVRERRPGLRLVVFASRDDTATSGEVAGSALTQRELEIVSLAAQGYMNA